jgi:transposase InsO family protein
MGVGSQLAASSLPGPHISCGRARICEARQRTNLGPLYVEPHDREDADTNADALARAIAHFAELGLSAPRAVMTDNAFVYTHSRCFRQLLDTIGARHITTPPYTPRWNGKAERAIRWWRAGFWQGIGRERASPPVCAPPRTTSDQQKAPR